MSTAFIYARYSSDNQRQESIDAQLQAIQAYAEKEGITIVAEYIDKEESATSDRRPEFQKMFLEVKAHPPDFVIVHKLDRFARNRYDAAIYRKKLRDVGTKLVSVLEKMDDSPESIILMAVLEGMAEYYSVNLSREVMKGLLQNAQKGVWNGGKPPIGYGLDSVRKVILDEATAPVVRRIFEMCIEGYGYGKIAITLNETGVNAPRGSIWRKNTIYDILTNERYCGHYIYNQRSSKQENGTRNNHRMKPPNEVIRIENAFPAIIDQATWERVKERIEGRRTGPRTGGRNRAYLLTGFIWCGYCQDPFIGGGFRKPGKYPIYDCSRRGTKTCSNTAVNADFVEDSVIEMLQSHLFNDAAIKAAVPFLLKAVEVRRSGYDSELEAVQFRLKEEKQKMNKILDMVEEGIVTKDKLRQRINEKSDLLGNLREQEAAIKRRSMDGITPKYVRMFLEEHRDNLASGTFEQKRKTIETFLERVTVYRDEVVFQFKLKSVGVNTGLRLTN